MIAAYLIDPARRGYPLDELSAEAGHRRRGRGRERHRRARGGHARAGGAPARRLEEHGLTRLFHEVELPLVDVLVEMERAGVKLDVERLRGISESFGAQRL